MILTCLCFTDLDDTLYPLSCGIAKACGQNIKGNYYKTNMKITQHIDTDNNLKK